MTKPTADMVKQLELAWAAGFYDGEGSTKKKFNNYRYKDGRQICDTNVCMTVSQSELTILKRFQKAVNGYGSINGPYQYKPNKRPYWVWTVSYASSRLVYDLLSPYLGETKKLQYKLVSEQTDKKVTRKKAWVLDEIA